MWIRIGASVAVLLFAIDIHAAVIIDDFTDGALDVRHVKGTPKLVFTQLGISPDSTAGGKRRVEFQTRSWTDGAVGGSALRVDPDRGSLRYSASPGITAVNTFIQYGDLTEPLDLDITAGGADCLRFEFASTSFPILEPEGSAYPFFDFTAGCRTTDGIERNVYTTVELRVSATFYHVDVPFSYLLQRNASFDFTQITYVRFGTGNGYLPGSFELVRLSAVQRFTPETPSDLDGDFNNDGVVNLSDYTVWRDNLGAVSGSLLNDSTRDSIGTAQYEVWKANFGASVPSGVSHRSLQVPEPNAIHLLSILLAFAWVSQCRRPDQAPRRPGA